MSTVSESIPQPDQAQAGAHEAGVYDPNEPEGPPPQILGRHGTSGGVARGPRAKRAILQYHWNLAQAPFPAVEALRACDSARRARPRPRELRPQGNELEASVDP